MSVAVVMMGTILPPELQVNNQFVTGTLRVMAGGKPGLEGAVWLWLDETTCLDGKLPPGQARECLTDKRCDGSKVKVLGHYDHRTGKFRVRWFRWIINGNECSPDANDKDWP